MVQRIIACSFFLVIFLIAFSVPAIAGSHSENNTAASKEMKSPLDDMSGKKAASFPAHDSKVPHGKAQAPHMEELPHIHKFHKERVKKIKKHHGKYWLLSQVLLALCHLSILVIGYLHATH